MWSATLDKPDGDNDGATVCTDCDDNDGENFPGNNETCDGEDDDFEEAPVRGVLSIFASDITILKDLRRSCRRPE